MDRFVADFRKLDKLNVKNLSFHPVSVAPRKKLGSPERLSLNAGLSLGKGLDKKIALMDDLAKMGDRPPSVSVLPPLSPIAGLRISPSRDATIALGLTGSGFVFFGATASVGLYISTTREVGAFFSHGMGLYFPAVGASGGGELTYILGTPADLAGPCIAAGISVGPGVAAGGASLLFSPGPPLVLIGVSISITANTPSFVPGNIVFEVTNTSTKPLVRF